MTLSEIPAGHTPGDAWEVCEPEEEGIDSNALDEGLSRFAAVCGELGVRRAVVVRGGRIIWSGGEEGVRVPVYSCTKSFLSACLGLLWDDGRCSPDDLAWRYHPPLQECYPAVTLRHLATFTSGYNHSTESVLRPAAPLFAPDEAFHYSDQSDLLAWILTRIAGESLRSLFQRRIGDRIGLRADEWEWRTQGMEDGVEVNGGTGFEQSGVWISAKGLARFGWLAARLGDWSGRQLVSRRYFAYAGRPLVPATTPPHDPTAWYNRLPGAYGLNWWVNGITADGRRLIGTAPPDLFMAQGNKNSICFILPSWRMTLVRVGPDVIVWPRAFEAAFAQLASAVRQDVNPSS